jgi:hypothetical protein
MVLAPNDLFSWNNKYNKYIEYNITDTFTCFFLAMHTTYSVHADILKPWRGRLPWLPAVFSFYHVLSLPLSGLNWRSLFPPWGSDPPFPKMAPPFTGSAHTPLPGSGTVSTPAGRKENSLGYIPFPSVGYKLKRLSHWMWFAQKWYGKTFALTWSVGLKFFLNWLLICNGLMKLQATRCHAYQFPFLLDCSLCCY